ncbi:MAG: hypothetical protein H6Q89_2605, partial [Myxococcaceae bacterium]|nr:hypothetical protein [Myxococcaceae bacterium]
MIFRAGDLRFPRPLLVGAAGDLRLALALLGRTVGFRLPLPESRLGFTLLALRFFATAIGQRAGLLFSACFLCAASRHRLLLGDPSGQGGQPFLLRAPGLFHLTLPALLGRAAIGEFPGLALFFAPPRSLGVARALLLRGAPSRDLVQLADFLGPSRSLGVAPTLLFRCLPFGDLTQVAVPLGLTCDFRLAHPLLFRRLSVGELALLAILLVAHALRFR